MLWFDAPLPGLVDRVAWDPRAPDKFWRRDGNAAALGEWWLDPCGGANAVRLCRTPLDWLRRLDGWREGEPGPVCLLEPVPGLSAGVSGTGGEGDWRGACLRDLFWAVGGVVCDDAAQAEAVYRALRRKPPPAKLPDVYVAEDALRDRAECRK